MGLIGEPSRKQSSWQTERTGPQVVREKHDTNRFYYNLTSNGGPGEITIGSIPVSQKARILRIYLRVIASGTSTSYYLLNIDGSFWTFVPNTSGFTYEQSWDYENAPDMLSDMSLYVQQPSSPETHDVVVSVLYTLEPAEDGYFTPN